MSFEDSQNLTHCAPKSLSNKNYPYFVFLNFSDKTDLPVLQEFLPTVMSLLNIYKPCKRRFLLLSCTVLWLPCSSLGPQTIDVLEGVWVPLSERLPQHSFLLVSKLCVP